MRALRRGRLSPGEARRLSAPFRHGPSPSSGSCPGCSAIITRSGQNGNLPLHRINRQQSYYKAVKMKLQAFFTPFLNFFSDFFHLQSVETVQNRHFRENALSTFPRVSFCLFRTICPPRRTGAKTRAVSLFRLIARILCKHFGSPLYLAGCNCRPRTYRQKKNKKRPHPPR